MERNYIAFISYRHAPLDMAVAKKLHGLIEQYIIPKELRKNGEKKLGIVFRDQEELAAAWELSSEICAALDHTEFLVVLCSPSSKASIWVDREIRYFLKKHSHAKVLPVLLEGEPRDAFPDALTKMEDLEHGGVRILEPLAVDVRGNSEKEVLAKLQRERLRLFAAMLGCPYDALVQRENKRRMRKLIAGAGAVLTVALSFSGMLLAKNRQITEQKQQAQLSESRVLAADAAELLENGDVRGAIETAVAALPKLGDDRPYYAPAESVLMEAMDLFGGADAPELLSDTVLEQMTNIENFALSQDGKQAVTIDKYGLMHCFDTENGQLLWSTQVTMEAYLIDFLPKILFRKDQKGLLVCYENTLYGISLDSGAVEWSRELSSYSVGFFVYDEEYERIGVIDFVFDDAASQYDVDMVILSADTALEEQRITLETLGDTSSYRFADYTNARLPQGGSFSRSGEYFYFAYFVSDNKQSVLKSYIVDLTKNTVQMSYAQALEKEYYSYNIAHIILRVDGLLIAVQEPNESIGARLIFLDWEQGEKKWETVTPAELDGSWDVDGFDTFIDTWDEFLIMARSNGLYKISMADGTVQNMVFLPGMLSNVEVVYDQDYALTFSDGTYALALVTSDGFTITTEAYYRTIAEIGEHTLIDVYGGGIIQRYHEGDYFELSLSNRRAEGYVALVAAEAENQLRIKRPVTVEKPVEQEHIMIPANHLSCVAMSPQFLPGEKLVLGPLLDWEKDSDEAVEFYALVDVKTGECIKTFAAEPFTTDDHDYYFLQDGSGYVYTRDNGDVVVVREGKRTELVVEEEPQDGIWIALKEIEDAIRMGRDAIRLGADAASQMNDINILKLSDSVVQMKLLYEQLQLQMGNPNAGMRYVCKADSCYLTDGTVLTARTDAKGLTLWRNGENLAQVPLPRDHVHTAEMALQRRRLLWAGAEGYVLTAYCPFEGKFPLSRLALYDTSRESWTALNIEREIINEKTIIVDQEKPWLGFIDAEDEMVIFDYAAGEEQYRFPLQFPGEAVQFMDFLLDYTHLMLKTEDGELFVYELPTGELKLRKTIGDEAEGSLKAYKDGKNNRLYLIESNLNAATNGICVDLESWTVLGEGSGMVCFDEETGVLYHYEQYYDDTAPLSYLRVPDTASLVQLGQKMLDIK